ncbi:MAG TPA: DUF2723 domain-containing protein, partial [Candidatus Goldiibacteriota bacterium]|nr:DUF2723 domain-containing protein [Candidatus Goldiibacteriota bacterium]
MRIIVLASSFAVFCAFLLTSSSTIYTGDSGQVAAAAATLGISHPPGYPLYSLFGKVFSILPAGDIAFRLNIMSAFFMSLFVALFFLAARYTAIRFNCASKQASGAAALVVAVFTALSPL